MKSPKTQNIPNNLSTRKNHACRREEEIELILLAHTPSAGGGRLRPVHEQQMALPGSSWQVDLATLW
jgi:hypothetical protein